MAEFYDDPSGKLYFRAPAGGGNSIWDAPATDADIAANPAAYREYVVAKRDATQEAEMAEAEASIIDALKAENAALLARVADLTKASEAPPVDANKPAQ